MTKEDFIQIIITILFSVSVSLTIYMVFFQKPKIVTYEQTVCFKYKEMMIGSGPKECIPVEKALQLIIDKNNYRLTVGISTTTIYSSDWAIE